MKKVVSERSICFWEIYICSLISCLGIFEIGHLMGLLFEWPVSFCGKIILAMLAVFAAAALIVLLKFRARLIFGTKRSGLEYVKCAYGAWGVLIALLILQTFYLWNQPLLQTPGDITLETVNSFLASDRIYKISPLTGREYDGAPFRYEILCLPTVYSLLCSWFHAAPEMLVGKVIPIITLYTAYGAYYLLSGTLLGRKKESTEKRIWFLVIIGFLFLLSEGVAYTEGYGVLHGGYLGTTIRNSILVPFFIYAVLEKRWVAVVFCLLAEVCVAWTFWGFGVCAAILAGMVILEAIGRLLVKKGLFSCGLKKEEDSL